MAVAIFDLRKTYAAANGTAKTVSTEVCHPEVFWFE